MLVQLSIWKIFLVTEKFPAKRKGFIFVLSGPSGVGKDAIISRLKDYNLPWHFAITATTRPKRWNETNGVDYFFISQRQFQSMIDNSEFLEWAKVYQHFYGVPKNPIYQAVSEGRHVLIKVDVQGAETIRKLVPDVILIFLSPPSLTELAKRLTKRNTDSEDALKVRLATAHREMKESYGFHHKIINHDGRLDDTATQILQIVSGMDLFSTETNTNPSDGKQKYDAST